MDHGREKQGLSHKEPNQKINKAPRLKQNPFSAVVEQAMYQARKSPEDATHHHLWSDLKGLQTHVATESERDAAELRLEKMSHGQIVSSLLLLGFTALFCLGCVLEFAVASYAAGHSRANGFDYDEETLSQLLTFDLVLRSFSFFLLLVVFFTFGIKVLRSSYKRKRPITGEQWLVVFLAFILFLGPGSGGYFLFDFIYNYDKYIDLIQNTQNASESESLVQVGTLSPSLSVYTSGERTASKIFTLLIMSGFYTLYLLLKGVLSGERKHELSKAKKKNNIEKSETEDGSQRIKCIPTSYTKVNLPTVQLLALVALYFALVLTLSLTFEFVPSFVPFVGMISVIRVCIVDVQDYHELLERLGYSGGNFCAEKEVRARIISQTVIFLFELFLLVYSYSVSRASRAQLSLLSYRAHRASHLGYQFFSFTMSTVFIMNMLYSIILVSALPNVWWFLYRSGESDGFNVTVIPLHIIGLPAEALGMSAVCLLLSAVLLVLASAYLPATESSVVDAIASCWRRKIRGLHHGSGSREKEKPIYFCREKDAFEYGKTQEKNTRRPVKYVRSCEHSLRHSMKYKNRRSVRRLLETFSSRTLGHNQRSLRRQKSPMSYSARLPKTKPSSADLNMEPNQLDFQQSTPNVVVFETIVQMFSLCHLSYDLCDEYHQEIHDTVNRLLEIKALMDTKLESPAQNGSVKRLRRKMPSKASLTCCSQPTVTESMMMDPEENHAPQFHSPNPSLWQNAVLSEVDDKTVIFKFIPGGFNEFTGPMKELQLTHYVYCKTWDSHCLIGKDKERVVLSFRGTVSTIVSLNEYQVFYWYCSRMRERIWITFLFHSIWSTFSQHIPRLRKLSNGNLRVGLIQ